MKTKGLILVFSLCIIALLSSCMTVNGGGSSSSSNGAKNPLAGTSWSMDKPDGTTAIKVFSDKLYVVSYVTKAGIVLTQHSGTYVVKGDKLNETIEYALGNRAKFIGGTAQLTYSLRGNKLKSWGKVNVPNTVSFSEEWKRM